MQKHIMFTIVLLRILALLFYYAQILVFAPIHVLRTTAIYILLYFRISYKHIMVESLTCDACLQFTSTTLFSK
jgi:hypothetical protein